MKLRSTKILGMAVGQKSILVAEVASRAGSAVVPAVAEFEFPEGVSLGTPEKLGEAFGQFLRGRKFSTREVVIGLPAKRLVTRRKEVPPASPDVACAALRLQAEGEFSAEFDDLVVDYAGSPSTKAATTVLLIATSKSVLEQCTTMARVAGLKVQGITATTAAMGRVSSRLPGGDSLVLNLSRSGAELVLQHGEDATYLRHLNVTDSSAPESIGVLAGEIRRSVAALPRNGTPMTLALWNSAMSSDPGSALQERLSMPVTSPGLRRLVTTESTEAEEFAPAVTVALAALEPAGMPVDFLHSRLAPPKEAGKRTKILLGVAVGMLVAGLVAGAWYVSAQKQTELDAINDKIAAIAAKVKVAQAEKSRLDLANGWLARDPQFVACWRDVAKLFPAQGNTIWADSLSTTLSSSRQEWILSGECVNARLALDLAAAMKEPVFDNAKCNWQQQQTQGQIIYTYKIQFIYKGSE